ncbi:aminodeoxychorismate lyase [Anoxybacillus ayderensis]|uniref:aminodeoxychorismate lyase n=1 Tax=Anoxybacillus ayderensis TaxID=265546 RepID=UPI002E204DC5|nr:aminodeoxychorismate lyase [Anoxybacillus ayderensis]MED0657788.1 aminodeoxychorismate lyase [Anoxybacillus ayderensis]
MFVYVNGQVVKKEDARISPFDHGFMYGLGVFETFRVYDGHPFLLDDHLARLHNGLDMLNISCSITRNDVLHILSQLLQANGYRDAYVRLNVSAGIGDVGLQVEQYTHPTIIMYMKRIPAFAEEKVCKTLQVKRNTPEGCIRLKSHHYLNNILGKREIGHHPNVEGIFLTEEGCVAEGIVSNIFWVKDGVVYTPAVQTGILNGVTRMFVIDLLHSWGIRVEEGFYSLQQLKSADEIFLTNSIQEVVPVCWLDEDIYPGKCGEITKRLQRAYASFTTHLWTRYDRKDGYVN